MDPRKEGVEALSSMVRPAVRGFSDVLEDPEVAGRGLVLHVDGAGSKPIIAYLHYRETGDPSWFSGLVQDVLAMNVDDAAAVGARPLLFADYVVYNSLRIRGEDLLPAIASGLGSSLSSLGEAMSGLGGGPALAGGETAQSPDQVGTLDVAGAVLSSVGLEEARRASAVEAGMVIVGLRSGGRSRWEPRENSGIMCNGLTLARHVLLSPEYRARYPEAYSPEARGDGRFRLEDSPDGLGMTVGEALSSPTRIFAPVALESLRRCAGSPMAMAHVTGGGHTKILRLGSGVRYVLDGLPEPDPIFGLIREEGRIGWAEMYESFNMGIGFEILTTRECAEEALRAAELHGVGASIVGRVERWAPGENSLVIRTRWAGELSWRRALARWPSDYLRPDRRVVGPHHVVEYPCPPHPVPELLRNQYVVDPPADVPLARAGPVGPPGVVPPVPDEHPEGVHVAEPEKVRHPVPLLLRESRAVRVVLRPRYVQLRVRHVEVPAYHERLPPPEPLRESLEGPVELELVVEPGEPLLGVREVNVDHVELLQLYRYHAPLVVEPRVPDAAGHRDGLHPRERHRARVAPPPRGVQVGQVPRSRVDLERHGVRPHLLQEDHLVSPGQELHQALPHRAPQPVDVPRRYPQRGGIGGGRDKSSWMPERRPITREDAPGSTAHEMQINNPSMK